MSCSVRCSLYTRRHRTFELAGAVALTPETVEECIEAVRRAFGIEHYHRSLKQDCGAERAQCRSAVGQRNHLLLSIRAYVPLEWHRVQTGVSLDVPTLLLPSTA